MQAKVTEPFKARPDGEKSRRRIDVGEILSGALAALAIDNGWAIAIVEEHETLSAMTIAELKAHAGSNDIDLGDARKKADIIAVIKKSGH